MNNIVRVIILFCTNLAVYGAEQEIGCSYVSYGLCGRLGDSLLSYSHAEWLSYRYNLPILYSEFKYSNELKLVTKAVFKIKEENYCRVNYAFLKKKSQSKFKSKIIYEVPYFSDFPEENNKGFLVDWADPVFRKRIRESIAPLHEIALFNPQTEILSIAVHIRTVGGYDPECIRQGFPHKFCDLDFYVEAIKKFAKLMENRFCYVRVFSDAVDPIELIKKLQSKLEGFSNILLEDDFSRSETHTVLADFFSLSLYPVLIRSQSNFSYMAARIGVTCLEVFPKILLGDNGEYSYEIQLMRMRYNDEMHSAQIVNQVDEIYLKLQ